MFEDLELPELERKKLREIPVAHGTRRLGYRRAGIRTHLDKKRTARSRLRRRVATGTAALADPSGEDRFPFHQDDLRYRRRVPDVQAESNAVVICIMDTSGSMSRSEEHTSELQSLMRISYAVFCLTKKNTTLLELKLQRR